MALLAALVATVVAGGACRRLFRRWRRGGRNPALLAWTISLGMFTVASAGLLVGVVVGWSAPVVRLFYLFGAVLNVPWLALGCVLANARDPWTTRAVGTATALVGVAFLPGLLRGDLLAAAGVVLGLALGAVQWGSGADHVRVGASLVVVAFTLVAVGIVLVAALPGPLPAGGVPEGRELFGPGPRSLAVGANTVGTLVVVVGALVASGRLMWTTLGEPDRAELARAGRRGRPGAIVRGVTAGWRAVERARLDHVVRGNLLVMAGVVVAAGSGGPLSFLGDAVGHAVGIGLGVVLVSAGFARTARPRARRIPGPVPPVGS